MENNNGVNKATLVVVEKDNFVLDFQLHVQIHSQHEST
jgi:hypothetical protein